MKEIPVYRAGRLAGWAKVDDEDYERLVQSLWHLNKYEYVYRYTKAGSFPMHRDVLGLVPGDGLDADHINGNGLDNRRTNLRTATRGQNIQNRRGANRGSTSRYRGVSYCKQTGEWLATVTIDRHSHWLGRHRTEDGAAAAAAAFRAKHMPFSAEFERAKQEEVA